MNYLQILFLCSKWLSLLPPLTSKSTTPSSAKSLSSRDPPTIPSGLLASNLLSNPCLFGDSSIDILPMMLQLLETKLNESPLIREFVALLPILSMILSFTMCHMIMLLQLQELHLIHLLLKLSETRWLCYSIPKAYPDSFIYSIKLYAQRFTLVLQTKTLTKSIRFMNRWKVQDWIFQTPYVLCPFLPTFCYNFHPLSSYTPYLFLFLSLQLERPFLIKQ